MVRPQSFRRNEQTVDNHFQLAHDQISHDLILSLAQKEFDHMVQVLMEAEIDVHVLQEPAHSNTPDAIFPNNWFTTHTDGRFITYPMFAPNRRKERQLPMSKFLKSKGYRISEVIDYSYFEDRCQFLEGTGAMVIDHVGNKVYAALSNRAEEALLQHFCNDHSLR